MKQIKLTFLGWKNEEMREYKGILELEKEENFIDKVIHELEILKKEQYFDNNSPIDILTNLL